MPKPFPLPFTIGTDICHVNRVLRILKGNNAMRFVRRLLRKEEIEDYKERLEKPILMYMNAYGNGRRQMPHTRTTGRRNAKEDEVESKVSWWPHVLDHPSTKWWNSLLDTLRLRYSGPELQTVLTNVRQELEYLRKYNRTLQLDYFDAILDTILVSLRQGSSVGDTFELAHKLMEECISQLDTPPALCAQKGSVVEKVDSESQGLNSDNSAVPDSHPGLATMEIANVAEARNKAYQGLEGVALFIAGRFAAKEAAIKAHRHRRLTYHDIAILKQPDNESGTQAPIAIIVPENGDIDQAQEVQISISHDGEYATATCIAPLSSAETVAITEDSVD